MPFPCPACGFLTVDGDGYGSYNICPICGWEDDAVQLANPACNGGANGESLIDAQSAAMAQYPLNVTILSGFMRDLQWRPLDAVERETAHAERKMKRWLNKAIYNPAKVYWNKSKPTYEINGNEFATLEGFFEVVSRVLIPNAEWGRNLDAFNDILRGGFGTPATGFVIRWINSRQSRESLGYPETIRQLRLRLHSCHPLNIPRVREELAAAESGHGPTVYDWLIDIIRIHCAGGAESADGVELVLE